MTALKMSNVRKRKREKGRIVGLNPDGRWLVCLLSRMLSGLSSLTKDKNTDHGDGDDSNTTDNNNYDNKLNDDNNKNE